MEEFAPLKSVRTAGPVIRSTVLPAHAYTASVQLHDEVAKLPWIQIHSVIYSRDVDG